MNPRKLAKPVMEDYTLRTFVTRLMKGELMPALDVPAGFELERQLR